MNYADLPAASGVYLLTHSTTGDTYVGGSKNIKSRIMSHINELRSGSHANQRMLGICIKSGVEFSCRVLELCPNDDLCSSERKWVHDLQPTLNINRPPLTDKRRTNGKKEKAVVTAKIDPELMQFLRQLADEDDRSLSYMVERALEWFVNSRDTAAQAS